MIGVLIALTALITVLVVGEVIRVWWLTHNAERIDARNRNRQPWEWDR